MPPIIGRSTEGRDMRNRRNGTFVRRCASFNVGQRVYRPLERGDKTPRGSTTGVIVAIFLETNGTARLLIKRDGNKKQTYWPSDLWTTRAPRVPLKMCFGCTIPLPIKAFNRNRSRKDGLQSICRKCQHEREGHDKIFRPPITPERHRAAYFGRRRRQPKQMWARWTVRNAIRDGRLIKQPCKRCGNPKSQAHHKDYSKPLNVVWLCQRHHNEVHEKQRRRAA